MSNFFLGKLSPKAQKPGSPKPKQRLLRQNSGNSSANFSPNLGLGHESMTSSYFSEGSGDPRQRLQEQPRSQKHGYLDKKPFKKNSVKSNSAWKKKWFLLQDSFLVWYNKRPTSNFDIHPAGCLPMGACKVFQIGMIDNGYGFEITHPGFNGASLALKSATLFEAQDWMQAFQDCQKATFENCAYGDLMVQNLRGNDKRTDEEMKKAMEEAKRQAQKAARIRAQNNDIMEEHLEYISRSEDTLNDIIEETAGLKSKIKRTNSDAKKKNRRIEKIKRKTNRTKEELYQTRDALERLEALVVKQPRKQRKKLERDIADLREYLDEILLQS